MSSESYAIYADEVGGSGNTSSANGTTLFDAFGTLIQGAESTSESYRVQDQLPGQLPPDHMSFSFAGGELAFDPSLLSVSDVSTVSSVATVATTARGGYTLAVSAEGDFSNSTGGIIDSVTDGSVTAGSEEYGVGVTGTDASFGDDRAVTVGNLGVAGRDGPTSHTGVQTTLTFKAAIDGETPPGAYSQTIVVTVTGTY